MMNENALAIYFSLIFARVAAFVAVMPLFSGRVPRVIRAAFALVLACYYFSIVNPDWDLSVAEQKVQVSAVAFALAMIRETILGAAMGLALGMFLLPARIGGEFLTTQVGLALSPQMSFANDQPASPYALVFETMGALLFFELDLHHVVFTALHASFAHLPLGGTLINNPLGPTLTSLSHAHEMGLLLIGPLSLCLFMLAIVLAIMYRVAPQLNIFTVGFPLQVLIALVGMIYFLPEIITSFILLLQRTSQSVGRYFG
jgi:flagellar biosynthetic protein FliR